jgi:hypothetical protein
LVAGAVGGGRRRSEPGLASATREAAREMLRAAGRRR